MGLFDFFKKKKQPEEPISFDNYIRQRKKEGGTDEEIKDEIMSSISIETSIVSDDIEPMKNLPTPKGNYSEDYIEILWMYIEVGEDDLDSIEYQEELIKTDKENYYYGKKLYENKFGELVGTPLRDVIKNLSELYEYQYLENEDYNGIVQLVIRSMGMEYKRWNLWFYGGKHMVSTNEGKEKVEEEGYEMYFRRKVCKSREIISDKDLIDFHTNYTYEIHLLTQKETRLAEVNKLKKFIYKDFCGHLEKNKYNKGTKTWSDFDINGVFLRVRVFMMNRKKPFPHYVWNLVSGNPFDRIYRICRDYMKWKGTKRTAQIVFDNVYKWENGNIFREGEPLKEYEYPLWINWNVVGKDFISMKTKLKKENKGGLEWLKDVVGGYIKSRVDFYSQFGAESQYFISENLLHKYDRLK